MNAGNCDQRRNAVPLQTHLTLIHDYRGGGTLYTQLRRGLGGFKSPTTNIIQMVKMCSPRLDYYDILRILFVLC